MTKLKIYYADLIVNPEIYAKKLCLRIVNEKKGNLLWRFGKDCEWKKMNNYNEILIRNVNEKKNNNYDAILVRNVNEKREIYYWDLVRIVNGIMKI